MEAQKIIFTIKSETLSIDSIPALLREVVDELYNETYGGTHVKSDGDTIEWSIKYENIKI